MSLKINSNTLSTEMSFLNEDKSLPEGKGKKGIQTRLVIVLQPHYDGLKQLANNISNQAGYSK